MLDIKLIRENPEKIKKACENKRVKVDIDKLLKLDEQKRKLIVELENLRAEQNLISKEVSKLKEDERKKAIERAKEKTQGMEKINQELEKIEIEFKPIMLSIPNPALEYVRIGHDEKENKVIKEWGKIPQFKFKPKDHIELGEELDVIDTERAGKVSGSRFSYLKNELAVLEYALVQFVFRTLTKRGFIAIAPPVMINKESMGAMGYLERGEDEIYKTSQDDLYLVGTSEQSVGPMHSNEIFSEKELPKRYVSFSTCYRREAGSYGKDVKGILRVHQFDKIEMFSFCHPDKSIEEHKFFLSVEEEIVQALKIPYHVLDICTGDLGDPAAAKYDIECWLPSQNQYRETHSTSNCTDFQARRLNIRFRNNQKKLEFIHTLNGTAFAIGRILIMIMENYQQADGSIKIPKVLRKYSGLKAIKKK
jgi:seryl-tRNA synthetase